MEDKKITYKDKINFQTLYQEEQWDQKLVRAKDLNEIKNKHNKLVDAQNVTNTLANNIVTNLNSSIQTWYQNPANKTYKTLRPKVEIVSDGSYSTGSIPAKGYGTKTQIPYPISILNSTLNNNETVLFYRLTIAKETTDQSSLNTYWIFDIFVPRYVKSYGTNAFPFSQTQIFRETSATYISKINLTFDNNNIYMEHQTTSVYNDTLYTSRIVGLKFIWNIYKLNLAKNNDGYLLK